MSVTISRLYDDYSAASQAVSDLEAAGLPSSDISILASNADNWYKSGPTRVDHDHDGSDDRAEGAGAGAGIGAVVGGAAGGIIGALTQAGISKDEAHVFAEGVRRGGTLVTARVPDGQRTRYETIFDRSATNIQEGGEAYRREGLTAFDSNKAPSGAEQRKEREIYDYSGMNRPL